MPANNSDVVPPLYIHVYTEERRFYSLLHCAVARFYSLLHCGVARFYSSLHCAARPTIHRIYRKWGVFQKFTNISVILKQLILFSEVNHGPRWGLLMQIIGGRILVRPSHEFTYDNTVF
jgi:hypothetical protein